MSRKTNATRGHIIFLVILAVLLAGAGTAMGGNAMIWKDDKGGIHIGDKPPGNEGASRSVGTAKHVPRQKADIEIYVTDTCPHCIKAINYLKSKGLRFKTYNVQHDRTAAQRMLKLSGGARGVPFAIINGTKLRGFSEKSYEAALSKK